MDYRDYISRQAVLDLMIHIWGENFSGDSAMQESIDAIRVLPSVTPQLSSELEKNSKKLEKATTKNDLAVDVPDNNVGNIDCISRADAIKAIQKYGVGCLDADDFSPEQSERFVINKLNELPSVTPQEPRWIPVSERLPNDRNWYLGIFKEPDTGWINPLPFVCDYVGRETKATTKEYWILRGFTDWDDYHIDYYFNLECVKWMPLPSSYERGEEA